MYFLKQQNEQADSELLFYSDVMLQSLYTLLGRPLTKNSKVLIAVEQILKRYYQTLDEEGSMSHSSTASSSSTPVSSPASSRPTTPIEPKTTLDFSMQTLEIEEMNPLSSANTSEEMISVPTDESINNKWIDNSTILIEDIELSDTESDATARAGLAKGSVSSLTSFKSFQSRMKSMESLQTSDSFNERVLNRKESVYFDAMDYSEQELSQLLK
jgi:hypothetical protein